MHSKACWILAPVFSVFLLCPLFGVDAEESPAGDTPQPIYEMNVKKQLTPEEEYAMQWGDVFVSDLAMLQPDTVYGDEATLTAVKAEGLTTPSVSVTAAINSDAVMKTGNDVNFRKQITGTDADEDDYMDNTDDYSTYTFNKDTVISTEKTNYA
jgi:hypothetical protein